MSDPVPAQAPEGIKKISGLRKELDALRRRRMLGLGAGCPCHGSPICSAATSSTRNEAMAAHRSRA
eukprot:3360337-Rhodomonas_salina.1